MGESFKAVCALVMCVAGIVAAVCFFHDRPDATVWTTAAIATVTALGALGILLALHFRRDLAPDYLLQTVGEYFNRGGFCFGFRPRVVDGVCWLDACYQNQHESPCVGRIALRPAKGFFLTRARIEAITFEIPCEGGAFGFVSLPVGLPPEVQGKLQSFEVGASVEYPEGRGRRLRFRDGIFLRTNANFGRGFQTALTVAGALGGAIVWSSPATVAIPLPGGVAGELTNPESPIYETWWRPGDPPLGA